MEIQKQSTEMRPKKSERISLETYLNFFHSNKQLDLTANFLQQIIAMHGYKRPRKAPKEEVKAAVKTMDLIDPSRSTLKERISSSAFISLEKLILDLNELNWQECCVTSVETFISGNQNSSDQDLIIHPVQKSELKKPPESGKSDSHPQEIEAAASSSASKNDDPAKKSVKKRKKPPAAKDTSSHVLTEVKSTKSVSVSNNVAVEQSDSGSRKRRGRPPKLHAYVIKPE